MNEKINASTIVDDCDYGYTDRIKVLRKKENLNQEEFAERIGVSAVMISDMERKRKRLSIKNAIEIRKQFNVSLDWIYGLSDDTRDFASNILVDLKDIFDVDFANKTIQIDGDLADFLKKIAEAYQTKEEKNVPDEAFKYWIDVIKSEYNKKLENNKGKTAMSVIPKTYYLQDVNEHFRGSTPKAVTSTGLPTRGI